MADTTNSGFSGQNFGTGRQGNTGGVMDDVKDRAQQAAGRAQEFASDLASRAGDAWQTTREGAQQFASTAMDQAGEAFDSFANLIRQYPVASVLCAFGFGFLMAGGMQCMMGGRNE